MPTGYVEVRVKVWWRTWKFITHTGSPQCTLFTVGVWGVLLKTVRVWKLILKHLRAQPRSYHSGVGENLEWGADNKAQKTVRWKTGGTPVVRSWIAKGVSENHPRISSGETVPIMWASRTKSKPTAVYCMSITGAVTALGKNGESPGRERELGNGYTNSLTWTVILPSLKPLTGSQNKHPQSPWVLDSNNGWAW